MAEDWCCEKLKNLKIKENRLGTLNEIKSLLNENPLEAVVVNQLLNAPEIYDCMEDKDREEGIPSRGVDDQFDLASDILAICMQNLTINSDMPQVLQRSLQHQQPRVRAIALNAIHNELQRRSLNNDKLLHLVSDELTKHILDALQDDETEIGIPAYKILTIVLEHKLNVESIRQQLLQMLRQNSTVKCRLFELGVNLAKRSASNLEKVKYILDFALSELDNDDVILSVNVLEIFTSLAEQNHGLIYLEISRVFDIISSRVENMHNKPLDQLLIPGVMKFFGKVSSVQPEKIISGYPIMLVCLFDTIHNGDVQMLPIALDTLANVCQTQKGIMLVETYHSEHMRRTLDNYLLYLKNLSSDMKIRIFNSLEVIFSNEDPVMQQTSEIMEKWFLKLADGTNMQFLLDFCRNPFPDIKVACLAYVKTLCSYSWGIVALKNTGGFVEYLIDRHCEFDKIAKLAKYEVVRTLSESMIFDMQIQLQMRTYVNEGPYYVESIIDIAVEGN
ncbi:26S proteasome non-ATPase regulatory subunit 5 [Teleopsis dalmanni]|uniref:26S proteasome non-ATPase regulatory subunit 5 n=1 Tax=Teleopsis dalmanni TaxID=139649 RepID=UPI000D3297A0|nr:26S proteasome non-ATPase regulatory subunit 5 [Teleopsis dalmanni]